MREYPEFKEALRAIQSTESANKVSRSLDPLAYSLEFEKALLPKITLLQATLDYVSLQLQSTHQRRLLTRLEHNIFAMAWLAFERGASFGLDLKEKSAVASAFLSKGLHSALQMIIPVDNRKNTLEAALKRLGGSCSELNIQNQFLPWDDTQNLSDLLDLGSINEIKLRHGLAARKLHYICQLSVFTSTPKKPDDYPLSVLVTPEEYFSLSTMWARKPSLWNRNALVTESGKVVVSRIHADSETVFRRDLGLLADLHLELAHLIQGS